MLRFKSKELDLLILKHIDTADAQKLIHSFRGEHKTGLLLNGTGSK